MRKFYETFLIGLCILVFPGTSLAQDASGVFMIVKGDIKVASKANPAGEPAKVGRKVFEGDAIMSGSDSRAKIVMKDKNVLNVLPDSKIVIEKYQSDANGKGDKNVELKVEFGKVRASVEQKYDGEKSKFNIKTPSAVAGVRGTDFIAGYNQGTKESSVVTFAGTVAVGLPGPNGEILQPVYVQKGESTTASQGERPEPPKPIPAEDLKQMNQESAAETAPQKQDTSTAKNDDVKEEKKEEKKDDKKEEKEEVKQAKEDVKEETKEEPKEEKKEAKKEEPKKEEAKKEEPKQEAAKREEPKAKEPAPREPASAPSASNMIRPEDLPATSGNLPPPLPTIGTGPIPGSRTPANAVPNLTNDQVNGVINQINTNSRVNIIIKAPGQ